MDIFSNRPLFTSCMLFLALSTAGYFLSGTAKLIIMLIAVVTLIFMCILAVLRYHSSKKKNLFVVLILCLIMTTLSLGTSYLFFDRNYEKFESIYDRENTIQGIITDVLYENSYSSAYQLTVEVINGEKDEHKAVLECDYSGALQIGDRISAYTAAVKPETGTGRYDERLQHMSEGIFVIYSSDDVSGLSVISTSNDMGLDSFFPSLNRKLSSKLTTTIGGDAGNLSSALLLGNKSKLSDPIIRDFKRAGASHILALSGMHMSLIMGAFMFLLKFIVKKSTPIAIISSFIALFYLALTGFSISAMRSVIMLLVVYLSIIISGLPDSLTSLSIAGVVIMIISPGAILDAGFWMSFASTFGILTYVTPINKFFGNRLQAYKNKFKFTFHKIIYSLITAMATSVAALFPLIAVMCIFIKELSLFSILSSLVLSLPTAAIIILSLILLPFCQIPYVSDALAHVIRQSANFMIDFCTHASDFENIVISLNYPFATAMAIILAIALLFSCISRKINPFLSLVPFAACIIICISTMFIYENINDDKINVAYINVSSNSDIMVLSHERQGIICDVSNGSLTSYEYALDELNQSRATEIKAIVITRYTHRHNATMYKLFQRYKVREILVPQPQNLEEYYKMERLFTYAQKNNVLVYMYERDESLRIFEHAYIKHNSTFIKRSTVPIDLIDIYTGSEHLTYVSPAYNESDLAENAIFSFSSSKHIIFGSRGPRCKIPFALGDDVKKIQSVVFSDETKAGYFEKPEFSFISYYLIQKGNKIEYYLPE